MNISVESLTLPREGEVQSGDVSVVRREGDRVLLAVIDALGHGPKAAVVARLAASELESVSLDVGVAGLIDALHRRLAGSRGAAALVCIASGDQVEGATVGNVAFRCSRSRVSVVTTPGILGATMRPLKIFGGTLATADRLAIYTDGIGGYVDLERTAMQPPLEACRTIMAGHRKSHDDATILVADVEPQ